MKKFAFFLLLLPLLCPTSASPCSLCPGVFQKQETLGSELERAKLVLHGWISDPQYDTKQGALPGSGTTKFHIDKVLKYDPFLDKKNEIVLNRYLPVLNPKMPPHYLVFCDVYQGKLDPYLGKPVATPALIKYLEDARKYRAQGRVHALQYYFQFLDHAEDAIAADAFLEFTKSTDEEVCLVARTLSPEKLRALLQSPKTNADFLSLLAFLLGSCGGEQDVLILQNLLARTDEPARKARDGVLTGLVALNPKAGWESIRAILGDSKRSFTDRFSAACAVRFCYAWKPVEFRQETLRCLEPMLGDGEVADLAIEDLRKWKLWDLTPQVLENFGKKTHAAPITQRAMVRYALSCPLPSARSFVHSIQPKHAELVTEIREGLQFEKGK